MLFYDHLLTFDDEVRLVWKAKPSMAKKLFLLNRYVVLGVLIAQAYCMILLFLFSFEFGSLKRTQVMNHFSDGSTISVGVSVCASSIAVISEVRLRYRTVKDSIVFLRW